MDRRPRGSQENCRGPGIWHSGEPMNFASIPSGSSVFVDVNVFIYSLTAEPTSVPLSGMDYPIFRAASKMEYYRVPQGEKEVMMTITAFVQQLADQRFRA